MITNTVYRAVYDTIAHDHVTHWQATGKNPFQDDAQVRRYRDRTVELIGDGSILDVGCGMGDLLMCFPDRERHGVDISEEYLEIARERGLEVTRAEAESLPFPDDSFDVVVATDLLEHVFDLNRVVSEMIRVARKQLVVRVPKEDEVAWDVEPYGFVHVRMFDEGTLHLLFGVIFDCTVDECFHNDGAIYLTATVS